MHIERCELGAYPRCDDLIASFWVIYESSMWFLLSFLLRLAVLSGFLSFVHIVCFLRHFISAHITFEWAGRRKNVSAIYCNEHSRQTLISPSNGRRRRRRRLDCQEYEKIETNEGESGIIRCNAFNANESNSATKANNNKMHRMEICVITLMKRRQK